MRVCSQLEGMVINYNKSSLSCKSESNLTKKQETHKGETLKFGTPLDLSIYREPRTLNKLRLCPLQKETETSTAHRETTHSMSGKQLFQKMYSALEKSVAAGHQTHVKEILKKQDALIQYKRMQYVNAGKQLTPEEDANLAEEVRANFASKLPVLDVQLLEHLNKDEHHPVEQEHVQNITTFLDSQREYIELLERYNPGISMKQTDKVKKTARRVGLEVPE